MEHVVIRKFEHLAGSVFAPRLGFAIEIRDRPGPIFKNGAYEDDEIWVQLHGGLYVAKAKIRLSWLGEYSGIGEIRARTKGAPIYDMASFWSGRPKWGYAAVGALKQETWITPFWAGPRTYGYEWVRLEDETKRTSWLDKKDAPRGGGEFLKARYDAWIKAKEADSHRR